jgi:hypothetical protein
VSISRSQDVIGAVLRVKRKMNMDRTTPLSSTATNTNPKNRKRRTNGA